MMKIHNFFKFIFNRSLSGIINGLFYAGLSTFGWIVIGLFLAYTAFILIHNANDNWIELNRLQRILTCLGIVSSLLTILFVGLSFNLPKWNLSEIHGWTFLNQTAISGTLFISSKKPLKQLWWLILSVSPSAFLQKIFINLIPGLPWDYVGTDDRSGKTWGMKVFNRKIRIPRLGNMKVKLIIALLCIVSFFIVKHHINKNQRNQPFNREIV